MLETLKKLVQDPDIYHARIETGGNTYKGKGETAYEALMNLDTDYTKIKMKGTVYLEKDGKKSEKFLYLFGLRRIMANKISKAGLAKDLEYLLK